MVTYGELITYKDLHKDLPKDLVEYVQNIQRKPHGNPRFKHLRIKEHGHKIRTVHDPRTSAPWLKDRNATPDDILQTHIRSILNKVNEENYKEFAKELMYESIKTAEHMMMLVRLIIAKALLEVHFCKVYAELCKELTLYQITDPDGSIVYFNTTLIENCQKNFMISISFDKKIEEDLNKIYKAKICGCICFIGELFNCGILTKKIIKHCIELVSQACLGQKAYALEGFSILIETVGKQLKGSEKELFELVLVKLNELKDNNGFSKKEKFLVLDVIDMYNKI